MPPAAPVSGLPRLLLHERVVVLASLAAVTALAWAWLLALAGAMPISAMPMSGMAMPMAMPPGWSAATFALTLAMWMVMMVGMMLPGAAPMILTCAAMQRRPRGGGAAAALAFAGGYLLVWGGFSVAATLLQWGLDRLAMLSPVLAASSTLLGGAICLLAGSYQLTPWKQACLRHCRSPFAFLLNCWRDGWAGALRMGVEHGAWCVGCCWLLMALLFVAGVMNLLWAAAIAAVVLAEKAVRGGPWIARAGGVVMAGYGVWLWLAA